MGLLRGWWHRRRAQQPPQPSGTPCRIEVEASDSHAGMIKNVQTRGLPYADAAALVDMVLQDREQPPPA